MKKYPVWMEGFQITGNSARAKFLGVYEAQTFKAACKKALLDSDRDMSHYDPKQNTYWGCRFFDNEIDARRSFG